MNVILFQNVDPQIRRLNNFENIRSGMSNEKHFDILPSERDSVTINLLILYNAIVKEAKKFLQDTRPSILQLKNLRISVSNLLNGLKLTD